MSTARAVLTRVGRIHGDISPTGPCCLVREKVRELAPRHVMDALGETMVVRHSVDRQILQGDQVKLVDDAAAVLMGEVAAPPGDPFMHPRHHTSAFGAFWRPLFLLGQAALCFGERLLLTTEEPRVGDLLPSAEGGKRLQALHQCPPGTQSQAEALVPRTHTRSRRTTCPCCCG